MRAELKYFGVFSVGNCTIQLQSLFFLKHFNLDLRLSLILVSCIVVQLGVSNP